MNIPLEFHLEIFSWTTSRASPQRAPPTQILRPVWPREPSTIQGSGDTSAVLLLGIMSHGLPATWRLATTVEGSRLVFRISKERCRRWFFFRTQMKTPLYMLASIHMQVGKALMSKSDLWQVPSARKRCVSAACACKQVNKNCVYTLLKKVAWQYFPTKSKLLTDQIQTLNCKACVLCMYPVSYGS